MDLRISLRDGLDRAGLLEHAKFVRGVVLPSARRAVADEDALVVVLTALLREDSNCVDVGAHRGSVLQHLVHLSPRGHHIAFEPLPQLAVELRQRFPEVDVRQSAAAKEAGSSSFVHVVNHPDYSGLRSRTLPSGSHTTTIPVQLEALDEVLDPARPVAFIKIDVEGGELGVLQGAERTLRVHQPTVVFEHGRGGSDHYGTTPEQVHDLLTSVGLRVFDLAGGGPYDRETMRRVFDERSAWNFMAHV